MINNKFRNRTVQEYLEGFIENQSEPEHVLARISKLKAVVEDQVREKSIKMNDAFRKLAKAAGVEADEKLKSTSSRLKQVRLKASLEPILSQLESCMLTMDAGTGFKVQIENVINGSRLGLETSLGTARLVSDLAGIGKDLADADILDDQYNRLVEAIHRLESFALEDTSLHAAIWTAAYEIGLNGSFPELRAAAVSAAEDVATLYSFQDELERDTLPVIEKLKVDVAISAEPDAQKINWTGSGIALKTLVGFLLKNRYIEKKHLNIFLSEHFLLKGKPISTDDARHNYIADSGEDIRIMSNGNLSISPK